MNKDCWNLICGFLNDNDKASLKLTNKEFYSFIVYIKSGTRYYYEQIRSSLLPSEIIGSLSNKIGLYVIVEMSHLNEWQWYEIRSRPDLKHFLNTYKHPCYLQPQCLIRFYNKVISHIKTKHLLLNQHIKFDGEILYRHGTMDMINFKIISYSNDKKIWNWLSYNSNVTISIIKKYHDRNWNWITLSENINIPLISKIQNKELGFKVMSTNIKNAYILKELLSKDINVFEAMTKYSHLKFDLLKHPNITFDDIVKLMQSPLDDMCHRGINLDMPLTLDNISFLHNNNALTFKTLYCNKHISLDVFLYGISLITPYTRYKKIYYLVFKLRSFEDNIKSLKIFILNKVDIPTFSNGYEELKFVFDRSMSMLSNVKYHYKIMAYILQDAPAYVCIEFLEFFKTLDSTLLSFKNLRYNHLESL